MDKNWTDQPDEVESLPVALRTHVDGRLVEIRADVGYSHAYVTVGNLFGSTTLRCASLLAAVRAAHFILSKKHLTEVPVGCWLLENAQAQKEASDGKVR